MTPATFAGVPQSLEDRAQASTSRAGQRSVPPSATALHKRILACRDQARAVLRKSIAARARAKRWCPQASSSELGSGPSPSGQLLVPAVPDAVRLSRRLARDLCDFVGMAEVADMAQLLTGEIATNVVVHTRTDMMRVVVEVNGGTLRVSVSDSNSELPTVRRPSETEPRGRGLLLVNSLSNEWGVAERPGGKLVWFTLSGRSSAGAKSPWAGRSSDG
ncbi:MAG TPA: ATP-binding protein [Acidimicrobiales bacterium]|nr:ATP-binding protein [Acidimicrobiales bacterium]